MGGSRVAAVRRPASDCSPPPEPRSPTVRTAISPWSTSRGGRIRARRPLPVLPRRRGGRPALIDELTDAGGRQLRVLVTDAAWESGDAAAGLSQGFLAFFAEHGELLRVADLAALEGDDRFRQLRTRLFNGVFLALKDLAHEARAVGAIDASASPGGIASVLTTMLTQVSSHRRGFESWGVSADELAATMAAVIDATVRGDGRASL